MRRLIIGGSDAGIAAGLRARALDPGLDVTLVVGDRYPNYSICGLPFYLSGETPDWRDLAHRDLAELEGAGLELLLDTTATAIDVDAHVVEATGADGVGRRLAYDRLVVVTGARAARPPIDGLGLDGVHVLRSVDHGRLLAERLPTARRGVAARRRTRPPRRRGRRRCGPSHAHRTACRLGRRGRSPHPHRLYDEPSYVPLGTTARKQGRIAGGNAAGGDATFAGSLGTQTVTLFDLVVARTGLRPDEAADAGFRPFTVQVAVDDHKRYYPGRPRCTSASRATMPPAACSARSWWDTAQPRCPSASTCSPPPCFTA